MDEKELAEIEACLTGAMDQPFAKHVDKLIDALRSERKALERAARYVEKVYLSGDCPASQHDAHWVCDKMKARFTDDSCSAEKYQYECWLKYFMEVNDEM